MQITIHQVAAKPEWLAKISAFLHDANLWDPFTYDQATGTFRLPLARIGYEFRQKHSSLGFLTVWAMPLVPAALTLRPVDLDSYEEDVNAFEDMDQLMAIEMADLVHIELHTREVVIHVRCTTSTTLTLADTGPPETRFAVKDYGRLVISEELIADLLRTPVA